MISGISHSIEHQFLPGIELKTEPVPAFLILTQGTGGKFMIKPGETVNSDGAIGHLQMAGGLHAGKGRVEAGVTRGCRFSAEPFFAVKDEGFEGGRGKVEPELLVRIKGLQKKPGIGVSSEGPVSKMNIHVFRGASCFLQGPAADLFGKEKLPGTDIGDGEMGEVHIAHGPCGVGLGGHRLEAVTEKGEFVAVGVPLVIIEVTGEVPPFGFEFRMGSVVARKRPGPRGEGALPFCGRQRLAEEDGS